MTLHGIRSARLIALFAVTAVAGGCLMNDEVENDAVASAPPPANSPPTISGTPPAAVTINQQYSFTPSASDPDGDALTFSVQNLPSWATFNTSNGQLSGQPVLGDSGNYADIQISVSDGRASASMSGFAIDVVQIALGSATLSWTAPTLNTDGSPLIDLAGYRIYYGTQSGDYDTMVEIDNPGITSFMIENLTPNMYFFVSTAVNSTDMESMMSNETSKLIN